MSWLEKRWYAPDILIWLLLPLTLLFWLVSATRRLLFRLGVKATEKVAAPVIVVGNISVGGNGKTPLVIRLCQWLKQQGYHPGVVSRGYGGKSPHYPLTVEANSDPKLVGDEPVLMRQHLGCPLVVDPDRVRGAQALIDQYQCDIIVCDDGLQHYRLHRDIEILVMDGERRHGNGYLLPMGPLREGLWRAQNVDFIVVNGGLARPGEHLMSLEPGQLVNVKYPSQTQSISELKRPAIAVAGIGNPQRFFKTLSARRVKIKDTLSFPDHHPFQEADIPDDLVLMTEKDAVKCRPFAKSQWWYLPVSAKLTEQFKQQLLAKIELISKEQRRGL
ncbi:tetraacyldisaccharide 4'-kinase [Aliiglaciecola sp. CAU 1673]|uniref:tetraacyldisaccharide 4'-kinase n=1 Tax=Aliiglaciecola sp. CAU 1673 TaxID=3032595 RepID=UPI0023DCC76E|nr:tetraacyldisaccharide 4'-kinase [Aliiglaciecola sp. CAU 1673]MDF2179983.1 tetraacyldisaccharide 4'-kinase [Aliiglaciecola sp. CAU 1673]